MGFMDKLKNMVNGQEDDYYDDLPDDMMYSDSDDDDYTSDTEQSSASSYSQQSQSSSYSSYTPSSSEKRSKVVNINSNLQLQVVLVKPERFEEATTIADHLNAKRTVVLNLEAASKELARRLVDFLSGVAYANEGQLKRVANSTFIITPFNVDLMGDLLLDELDGNPQY